MTDNEDEILRDLINSCSSPVPPVDDSPTELSIKDTVKLLENKYGPYWIKDPINKCVVIWASKLFCKEHLKEFLPAELYDYAMEYQDKGTVNGNKFPDNFAMLAFARVDPRSEYDGS